MEYGLNMGSVAKNYQTAPGQPSTAQGNQPNSAHGKTNQQAANPTHKNIMSHRVSYDQYGTSGGILAADLSSAQAANNG
jgi:hypothetical protein